ncbi:hypothetical protein TUBRATIS_14820 [Tubulinosema ratisbonensis]|uniref:Uncharacterized protein n=1 Tax=Tubulinosema ratisbonensis TaxID=291195 RepID=A0A437ALS4_9MICR|nr:hypothetical protein TUBRATIS_14820 [Tubulinosema ratisbonensis]
MKQNCEKGVNIEIIEVIIIKLCITKDTSYEVWIVGVIEGIQKSLFFVKYTHCGILPPTFQQFISKV